MAGYRRLRMPTSEKLGDASQHDRLKIQGPFVRPESVRSSLSAAANLIRVGPAVFLFRYYTAVRCTVSVACVA